MIGIFSEFPLVIVILAAMVAVFAGFVKGAVGFAMPMVMISGLSIFLPADVALAALIFPTLLANVLQALRQGARAAVQSMIEFRVYLAVMLIALLASAQLYLFLSPSLMFAMIGVPIVAFSISQLVGFRLRIDPKSRRRAELIVGGFAGFFGGVSGVWGPPTVALLTALDTGKADQMRLQGVIYGLGSVALFAAHLKSGVLNTSTAPFSLMLVLPAIFGLWLGMRMHDRMNADLFRSATLVVLVLAGLNLVRKALI